MQEGTEQPGVALSPLSGRASQAAEFDGVVGREVGERVHLEKGPESFHRIEFGSVRREELGADVLLAFQELLHADRLVRSETIPQQDEPPREMPSELAKEGNQIVHGDVLVRQEGEVKPQPSSLRGNGDRRNHGDLLSGAGSLIEDGSFSDRSPRAAQVGCHQKPALVEENKMEVQPLGVFFTRGHSSFTQRWISSSLRSRARRSGFWGLKPIARRRRAT